MTLDLEKICQTAANIVKLVGQPATPPRYLQLTDRRPTLAVPCLPDLLPSKSAHACKITISDSLGAAVTRTLQIIRARLCQRYDEVATGCVSLSAVGVEDSLVESRLIASFEAMWRDRLQQIRRLLARLPHPTRHFDDKSKIGGFGYHTTSILDAAFTYTNTPTSAEIDHLSSLTGLATHQVRTWFQNKRNRRNKRIASGSILEGPTQPPVQDGRRVASLPSRARKTVGAGGHGEAGGGGGRVTRPIPRRAQQPYTPSLGHGHSLNDNLHGLAPVPLVRTTSHDSDSTNFSFSSIPSNGGFTVFSYPTASTTPDQNPLKTADSSAVTPQVFINAGGYFPTIPESFSAASVEQTTRNAGLGTGGFTTDPSPPTYPLESLEPMNLGLGDLDLSAYLNLDYNIDSIAPPVDDLAADLEAQIKAALRPMDPSAFQNLTLAPSPSSSSSSGSGGGIMGMSMGLGVGESPVSEMSAQDWFPELSAEEAESMEMLKVFLDGMDFVASPMDERIEEAGMMVRDHSSPIDYASSSNFAPTTFTSDPVDHHAIPHFSASDSERTPNPVETIANIALNSGRATPEDGTAPSCQSTMVDEYELPVSVDSTAMDVDDRGVGCSMTVRKEDEPGWLMGVLPFEMANDGRMQTAA